MKLTKDESKRCYYVTSYFLKNCFIFWIKRFEVNISNMVKLASHSADWGSQRSFQDVPYVPHLPKKILSSYRSKRSIAKRAITSSEIQVFLNMQSSDIKNPNVKDAYIKDSKDKRLHSSGMAYPSLLEIPGKLSNQSSAVPEALEFLNLFLLYQHIWT